MIGGESQPGFRHFVISVHGAQQIEALFIEKPGVVRPSRRQQAIAPDAQRHAAQQKIGAGRADVQLFFKIISWHGGQTRRLYGVQQFERGGKEIDGTPVSFPQGCGASLAQDERRGADTALCRMVLGQSVHEMLPAPEIPLAVRAPDGYVQQFQSGFVLVAAKADHGEHRPQDARHAGISGMGQVAQRLPQGFNGLVAFSQKEGRQTGQNVTVCSGVRFRPARNIDGFRQQRVYGAPELALHEKVDAHRQGIALQEVFLALLQNCKRMLHHGMKAHGVVAGMFKTVGGADEEGMEMGLNPVSVQSGQTTPAKQHGDQPSALYGYAQAQLKGVMAQREIPFRFRVGKRAQTDLQHFIHIYVIKQTQFQTPAFFRQIAPQLDEGFQRVKRAIQGLEAEECKHALFRVVRLHARQCFTDSSGKALRPWFPAYPAVFEADELLARQFPQHGPDKFFRPARQPGQPAFMRRSLAQSFQKPGQFPFLMFFGHDPELSPVWRNG